MIFDCGSGFDYRLKGKSWKFQMLFIIRLTGDSDVYVFSAVLAMHEASRLLFIWLNGSLIFIYWQFFNM